jgi:uncharacterized protein (DUF362 family)
VRDPRITVIYGREALGMAKALLADSGVARELRPDTRVLLKPNLVTANPASTGATTTPELVAGVIEFLQECGVHRITIGEGSWVGCATEKAFRACGYEELARRYGVALLDFKRDAARRLSAHGLEIRVCERALDTDLLFNLPVLKGHCQTGMTCALKNLKGCIPDEEKRRFHSLGLHRPIAVLASLLPTRLTLVDALCGDLSFEEGGTPVRLDRLLLGADPVLVDSYAAGLMGFRPGEVEHLRLAAGLGVGRADCAGLKLRELGRPPEEPAAPAPRSLSQLARYTDARAACSACYGGLLHALKRLSDQGLLARLPGTVCVGQGFRGSSCDGVGIGVCTRGFRRTVPGCPPTAGAVLEFLRGLTDA